MTPARALDGARHIFEKAGYLVEYLGDDLEGEARELGAAHAALARTARRLDHKICILSGGETTVTLRATGGRGGRNAEYLLGLALGLEGAHNIWAMAADTDGIDGSEDNAGVLLDSQTLARARNAGIDPVQALAANNAYGVFEASGGLFKTGPTHTNVNDFRAMLIHP
jgi:glycerate 2-kinase